MAEGLFREMTKHQPDLQIGSAGVYAADGYPASPEAVVALKEEGIDISNHRSRYLTQNLLNEADLIVVMTNSHRFHILQNFPEMTEKIRLLHEFNPEKVANSTNLDLQDPHSMGQAAYYKCRDSIKKSLPFILNFIQMS